MTTFAFHTTVLDNGMLAVPLPEEFRGTPVKIVAEQRLAKSPVKKGVLGLRGILKGYTVEELENARDEYLLEKYIHDKSVD
jgi:hypothetical protein